MIEYSEPKKKSRPEARRPVEREQEFDKTLVECIPNLKRVARLLTRNSELIKELVQTTLVKAMQDRNQFKQRPDDLKKMQAWTATILRNTFRDIVRHTNKNVEDGGEGAQDAIAIAQSPVDTQMSSDLHHVLVDASNAIESLAPGQREAIKARALGYTDKETVAKLNRELIGTRMNKEKITIGTLKRQTWNARRQLEKLGIGEDVRAAIGFKKPEKKTGPEIIEP